ncbi:MAG: XrtB/PEP-CTERM-associated transcriptional regulator EpsA, partial [Armatimonadota bacterium]
LKKRVHNMDTVQVKVPRWMVACGVPAAPWSAGAAAALKPSPEAAPKGFQLTAEESVRFLRIVSECGRIRRHYDIYRWLSGEVQHFLPHEILLSAWGDFVNGDLKLDLASALPGVRTAQLAHCRVDPLIRQAYARWIDAGRSPVLLKPADIEATQHCHCAIHAALRDMRSLLVHGVHDKRSGHESLFIALSSGSFTKGRSMPRFISFLDPLVAQIDAAFRKVPAFPLAGAGSALRDGANMLDLSARELEVLESICRGKTNLDIAAALDISPFTVKNHVQRIFRKIGVTNRTQAAARYSEALRQAASSVAKRDNRTPGTQTTEAFQPSAA